MLLVDRRGDQQVVAEADGRARAAGVRTGMKLAEARALLPASVEVHPHEPDRDAEKLRTLARWAMRLSPLVAPDPPDGLLLEMTGCEHLYGGADRTVRAVVAAVERLGVGARAAMAPTVGGAWAVARYGPETAVVVPEDALEETLSPLPVAALRLDATTRAALSEVALDRIGQLRILPRSSLATRFGPSLLERLDQAHGQAFEGIEPLRPREPPVVRRTFDGPVKALEPVQRACETLLVELLRRLEKRECGAREIEVIFDRVDAPAVAERLVLSRPSRDARHLRRLLRPRTERMSLGHGVEGVRLKARVGRLPHTQQSPWATEEGGAVDEEAGRLVDQLVGRLGRERVGRVEPAGTHVPERASRWRPVDEEASGEVPPLVDADRPSAHQWPPEPIRVVRLAPDGPILRITRRGATHRVERTVGPERIEGRWWLRARGAPRPRDYFKCRDSEGRWWWIYQEVGRDRWFIQGRWL